MSIKYNTTEITPKYPNTTLSSVYYTNVLVWTNFTPITKTFSAGTSLEAWTIPSGTTKLQVDCVASKGKNNARNGGNGGRVQCYLSVTAGQILYFTVGGIPSSDTTASYNASDIRTNNAGVTDTTSLNSRLVVAGGGGTGGGGSTSGGIGGAGGGLTGGNGGGANYGHGGTQTAGGQQSSGSGNKVGSFGLGGNASAKGGAGGAGWYGGGAGTTAGGGGSSYTHPTLCTQIPSVDIHTQGYQNGAGYITIITMNS